MPRRDLTFRVFVSSTFSDMKAEREILQKKVFPILRDYCRQRIARALSRCRSRHSRHSYPL